MRLSKNAIEKIIESTKGFRQTPFNEVSDDPIYLPGGSNNWLAVTTATIAAASGSGASTNITHNTGNLYTYDGTTLHNTGMSVNLYNQIAAAIASGTLVQVKLIGNLWFVDVASC